MHYRRLGGTGLKVSPLCLGTLMFGAPWSTDHDQSIRIIHRALDAGINFLDTGNSYSKGETEEVVGRALRGRRDQVVVTTKVHFPVGPGPNDGGNSRSHMLREVENSLRRLHTDYIDLYQLHRPDPHTPIEETLRALDALVRSGKVRYIGTSRFKSWQLVESLWVSDKHNLVRVVCEEPGYSIFQREIEKEILPVCAAYGIGVLTFSPLNRGWLAGEYRVGQLPAPLSRVARGDRLTDSPDSVAGQRKLALVEQLIPLANELGVTLSQYALAWILANPVVTAPISGPLLMEHLEDNLGALQVTIPESHLRIIDTLVPPGTDL